MNYQEFLGSKIKLSEQLGFDCDPSECHPILKDHQRAQVAWAVRGGRRALFDAFGLGKSIMQMEIIRLVLQKSGKPRGLIVCPLGVRSEFRKDAEMIDLPITFVRTDAEAKEPGIYLTNYESVREGKIDPSKFDAVSLDEAAILRGFGGTKTFREFMRVFEGTDTYRFVATATPSPNDYIELLAYAAFLDVMDVGQAKTRFFKRDSTKSDNLTILPNREREFWLWIASWAIFVQKPSDLGFSDEGYIMPELRVRWHEVPTDHTLAYDKLDHNGQAAMMQIDAIGVSNASKEKRRSLDARIAKMLEIRAENPDAHRIIWHDLEDERKAIEHAIPSLVSVYGSQDLDDREKIISGFSDGTIAEIAGKPVMLGSGCNFQRHCHHAIYLGIGFKFADFIQSVHRLQRFLQTEQVTIDLIYTEAERGIREALELKWANHIKLVSAMTEIIREFGLCEAAMFESLTRTMGVERQEASGANWKLVNNDSVLECRAMEDDSVGLILSSIPFGTQYEYSSDYADFGHNEDNTAFWKQMEFLGPDLFRVLQPGRMCCIHVKDRVTPGGISGLGFQTVDPFHAEAIYEFKRYGFAYLGMITIDTDVVRENNQTYRLGWTEQCKDGSRMGVGMPEYLLLFRKPPSDLSDGYADIPVLKNKEAYTRARWQLDAKGLYRSSGDRLPTRAEIAKLSKKDLYRLWKRFNKSEVYDFEEHVKFCEDIDAAGMLPTTFALVPPHSVNPHIWTDVTRMRTLNMIQAQKGREFHVCPMQFDVATRVISRCSNPGDVVFDPFSGLGTVPKIAVELGRVGWGWELNPSYWEDSVLYLKAAESQASMPTLFDLLEIEADDDIPTEVLAS
jgi:DNA modification methylase